MPPRERINTIATMGGCWDDQNQHHQLTVFEEAVCELASMGHTLQPFPRACRRLVMTTEGNDKCVDCGAADPNWATVSYGALICMRCSGHHRSLGVKYSKVRSITMDHWTKGQVLAMLEGGNEQLQSFFARHQLSSIDQCSHASASAILRKRYWTKAAKFYQNGMKVHVERISSSSWQGREASRKTREDDKTMRLVSPTSVCK